MFLGPTILLKQILENLIVPRIVAAILGETVEGIVWGRGGGGHAAPVRSQTGLGTIPVRIQGLSHVNSTAWIS